MYIVTKYIECPAIVRLKALIESLANVLKCLTNIAVVRSLYSKNMQMNGNNKQSKTR